MSEQKKKPPPEPLASLSLPNNAWPVGDELQKQCQRLWELMMPKMSDGVLVRQPGRLTIAVESGHWKVGVHCPTEAVQTSFYLDELSELWETFELLVMEHKLIWVTDYRKAKKEKPVVGQ